MAYPSLHGLFDDQLHELYAAEHEQVKHMPALIEAAVSLELKTTLQNHLTETEKQFDRLQAILTSRGVTTRGRRCRAIDSLLKQGADICERGGNEMILDLGLIFTVRQIENVERGLHEITRTLAEALGLVDIVRVLDQSRDEEDHMERALTVLGDDMIDTIAAEVAIIGRDKRQGTGVVSP